MKRFNGEDRERFIAMTASVFEHSSWIAEAAWERRPFTDFDDLFAKMCTVVEEAPPEAKLALIRAHPDLAGRLAREGRLTPASKSEQQAAGLGDLNETEHAALTSLNARYRKRFEFPFVICAREHTKGSIVAALEKRMQNERDCEIQTALAEIMKIARLRLAKNVNS